MAASLCKGLPPFFTNNPIRTAMKTNHFLTAALAAVLAAGACVVVPALSVDRHADKLWLHRCNSVEKYAEMHTRYPNVEVDVVFRPEGYFDVTHDADTTFGLTLDSLLGQTAMGGGNYWLDIKNLTPQNQSDMLSEVDSLCTAYDLSPHRLILESPRWQLLAPFTRRGYYTSCYVAYEKPSRLPRTELSACIDSLRRVADSGMVRALSFPGWWYASIRRHLHRSIDLLTWKHRTTQFEFFLTSEGWRMLRDKQLKVVLIKDKGHYHR